MGNVALGSFPAIKVISMRIFFLVKHANLFPGKNTGFLPKRLFFPQSFL